MNTDPSSVSAIVWWCPQTIFTNSYFNAIGYIKSELFGSAWV